MAEQTAPEPEAETGPAPTEGTALGDAVDAAILLRTDDPDAAAPIETNSVVIHFQELAQAEGQAPPAGLDD